MIPILQMMLPSALLHLVAMLASFSVKEVGKAFQECEQPAIIIAHIAASV